MAHRFVHKQLAQALAIAALVAISGCASKTPSESAQAADAEPVNSGLAALMRDSTIDTASLPSGPPESLTDSQVAALVQRSALDLERLFAEQAQRQNQARTRPVEPDAIATSTPVAVAPTSPPVAPTTPDSPSFALSEVAAAQPDSIANPAANPAAQTPPTTEPATVAAGSPDAPTPTAPAPDAAPAPVAEVPATPDLAALANLTPEDRVLVETAARIIDLMKPAPAAPNAAPTPAMNEALALAAIESIRPGTLATIDDPNGVLAKGLSPERFAALRDARDRIAQNPAAANGAARQALTTLAPSLQMANLRLCTRVMGFGRYDAYSGNDFVAGRPIRAIVYAEIDGFQPRPAKEGDPLQQGVALSEQKTVDLSQSLTLYHDAGTMQAWHRPFQRVMETSRNVRQDFYLIQQIELPKNLPIGEYRLKVTVRDNTTGAENETFIPIRVVVGPGAVTDAR